MQTGIEVGDFETVFLRFSYRAVAFDVADLTEYVGYNFLLYGKSGVV